MTIVSSVVQAPAHPGCSECGRHRFTKNVGQAGWGDKDPDIVIITPYVTMQCDQNNMISSPSNPAYEKLHNMIAYLRENGLRIWVTTVVRCCKTKQGQYGAEFVKPDAKEIRACLPWLISERGQLQAKVTILLGADTVKTVLGYKTGAIQELRLNPIWTDDHCYIATFHPAMMLERKGADNKWQAKAQAATAEQYADWISEDFMRAADIAFAIRNNNQAALQKHKRSEITYHMVEQEAEAIVLIQNIINAGRYAGDIETNTYQGTPVENQFKEGLKILCVGFNTGETESWIVPFDWHIYQPEIKFRPSDQWMIWFIEIILALPETNGVMAVWQNGLYDIVCFYVRLKVNPYRVWRDTMYLHHLLRSHEPHDLETFARSFTQHGGYVNEIRQEVAKLPTKERGYHKVHWTICARKNAYDTAVTFECDTIFWAEIQKWPRLVDLYWNDTLPAAWHAMEMSLNGLWVDEEARKEFEFFLTAKVVTLLSFIRKFPSVQNVEELTKVPFNPGSSAQKIEALYYQERLPIIAWTKHPEKEKRKPACDKLTLAKLAEEHQSPLAYCLIKYSLYEALLSKMVQALPNWMANTFDGALHGFFNVHGTRTGRWSGREPNFQNFPKGGDPEKGMPDIPVMYCFVSRKGKVYLYPDISQAEYRTAAHATQEPALMKVFQENLDYHATIAQELFDVDYEEAKTNDTIRGPIKRFNFGLFYGLTPEGLARQANISIERAKDIFKKYFAKFTLVEQNLFLPAREKVMKDGYVESLFGRLWWNFLDLRDERQRQRVFRQVVNYIIQSSSSSIVSAGIRDFREARDLRYSRQDVMMVNSVHDSLIVEVREDLACEVGQLLQEKLQNPRLPFQLTVPWVADLKIGYRLGAKELYKFNPFNGDVKVPTELMEGVLV